MTSATKLVAGRRRTGRPTTQQLADAASDGHDMQSTKNTTILHILNDQILAETAALQRVLEAPTQADLYLRMMPFAVAVASKEARAQIVPALTLRGVTGLLHVTAICRQILGVAAAGADVHRAAIASEYLAELDEAVRTQPPGPYRLTTKLTDLGMIPSVALTYKGQTCVAFPRHIYRNGRNHYYKPACGVTIVLSASGPEYVPEDVAKGMMFELSFPAGVEDLDEVALDILGRAGLAATVTAPDIQVIHLGGR